MALTLDFTGKHVFVFGGTTGIGFGVAESFSKTARTCPSPAASRRTSTPP